MKFYPVVIKSEDKNIEIKIHKKEEPEYEIHEVRLDFGKDCEKAVKVTTQKYFQIDEEEQESHQVIGSGFTCDICHAYFTSRFYLDIHRKFHLEPNFYKCEKCGKIFKVKLRLLFHKCTAKSTQYRCKFCDQFFSSGSSLCRHLKLKHTDKLDFVWLYCSFCNDKFKTERQLQNHERKCQRVFICDHCGMQFENRSKIYSHVQSHARYKVECEFCHAHVKPRSLNKHMAMMHEDPEWVDCDVCGKSFKKYNLRNHRKIHVTKNFQCNFCDLKFLCQGKLNYHMKYHENPDQFKCKICGLQLTTKGNLVLHNKRSHEKDYKKFNCNECGRKFYLKSLLTQHLKYHAAKNHENHYKLQCDYCDNKFVLKRSLRNHLIKKH